MDVSKMQQLPYTLAIIKPDTAVSPESVEEIMKVIADEGFQVYEKETRVMDKEDVINLFARHKKRDYFQDILEYMTSGPSVVLLLTHETVDPVQKWKELCGAMDPVEAKAKNPDSLRGYYGSSKVRNELHGSDSYAAANRERDIFDLPIPVREPPFSHDKFLVTMDTLVMFLLPPNLEHSNVSGRLDLFGLYGPVVNWHSVDLGCFCKGCVKTAKTRLPGLPGRRPPGQLAEHPVRLLREVDYEAIWGDLCEECKYHYQHYAHLPAGRGGQHLATDIEILKMIEAVNKADILDMLTAEKGSTAKVMIETVDLNEPEDIRYTEQHVRTLLSTVPVDYYNRMNFHEVQTLIMEDRRIRITYWVSKMIGKPVDSFVNPAKLNTYSSRPPLDLGRTLPLTLVDIPPALTAQDTAWDPSIVDMNKLGPNGAKVALLKRMHREAYIIAHGPALNSRDTANNILLLRNYAPGRHGSWNNYCCIKGTAKGSFVQAREES